MDIDLAKLIENCGVKFYDTSIKNDNSRQIYTVFITKKGGVNLDDCEKVSKILSPIFDVNAPLNGQWTLEVSSPGLERKLDKLSHFENSIGENVKISLLDKTKISGEICAVNGENIEIKSQNGEICSLKFDEIKSAKTFIVWDKYNQIGD